MIKIDVEGAEWGVLQGLLQDADILSPKLEIVVEVNVKQLRADGRTLGELLQRFAAHGFAALHIRNTYELREHFVRAERDLAPVDPTTDAQLDILFTRSAGR